MNKAPLKGMKDFLPEEMRVRDYVQGKILGIYRASGFERISTPILEDMENLDKSDGGDNLNLIFKVLKRGEKLEKALAGGDAKALCDMGESLTALTGNDQVNALMGIVYDIGATLRRPVADEGQAKLTHTMVVLSGDLESVAAMKYGRQDTDAAISDALKKAENGIAAFLDGDQAYEESEKEELRPENRSKFTESQSADAVKLPSETQYVYDPPQAAHTDGYVPGETDASGNPQRILAPQDESLDGTVPYGQVLSRYYAAYLEELDTLPQALLEEMETYFDGL